MEQGLAQQSAMQDNEMGEQSEQGSKEQLVQQVVQLLMQGAHPDELLKQGVPMEIIKEAIEIITGQEQQEATANSAPSTQGGLAMSSAGRQ